MRRLVTTIWPGLMRAGSPRHAFFNGRHRAGGLFPGFTAELLGLVNRCLPSAQENEGGVRLKGEDSVSALSPSWLTRLGDRAAKRNNQTT